MRFVPLGLVVALVVSLSASPALAGQAAPAAQGATVFSGLKLVDLKARTPEATVTVTLKPEALVIMDPALKKEVKSLPYSSITGVTHTFSNSPPKEAGDPAAAATQRGQMPTYQAKNERHWLVIHAGADQTVLRVSTKVYDDLKVSLGEHNVAMEEGK